MSKTMLITGSTDGIGLETAKKLITLGHHVIIHGRNAAKLQRAQEGLTAVNAPGKVSSALADLSTINEVKKFAEFIISNHPQIDVLINNAGILKTSETMTTDGLDIRFAVNTVAPYLLTQKILPILSQEARILNLSSAAQAPVDIEALMGKTRFADDMSAYAQSKLALTMWSNYTGANQNNGPVILAINPGSLLGSKMVKDGFGIEGKDIGIGADILVRAALDADFADKSGQYFDNDIGQFSNPHADAMNDNKCNAVIDAIESLLRP